MPTLTDRQQQLHEMLQNQRQISMEEIIARLRISTATAYRDAHALIRAGVAEKTNRGIRLARPPEPAPQEGKCGFCGGAIHERVFFVLQMQDGSHYRACCPHCGLMALNREGVVAAMANDFIYGHTVNARQATFLVASRVHICCEPSVLCFANEDDARRFQSGFGGELCSLDEARARLNNLMSL